MNNLCQLNQAQLLDYIHKISLAVTDIVLFLDSHPECQEALAYYQEHIGQRNAALKEYTCRFGPLTIDTADEAAGNSWEWVYQKWPWEGGCGSCGTMKNDCNIR